MFCLVASYNLAILTNLVILANLANLTKLHGEVGIVLQVNILEAKTDLSKLIRLLESKREDYITVARNGKPVARITLINETPASKRIGVRKGKFSVQGDFDADNREIEEMLAGGAL